ncbi:MAG: hypothetical protein KAG91_00630 [Mycoplasmataceae bacterium]|nr:hypothetical protein [Mycoplasmataceae bacterium]
MTKSKLKREINKPSTIIKVTKETKDEVILKVIIQKGGTSMPTTKEILLEYIQYQTNFNEKQEVFNNNQTEFNKRIEAKVDNNTEMIKEAHPDLFKNK